jgi:hypothetical protein
VAILMTNSLAIFWAKEWTSFYILGGILTGAGIILTVFGIISSIARKFIPNMIKKLLNKNVPKELIDEVESFKHLDVSLIRKMLTERVSSSLTMVNDIFLKQLRRLNYDLVKSKPQYENRVITSTVYKLNGESNTLSDTNGTKASSKRIQESAIIASQMPTTLWWDDIDRKINRQDNLIACGQYTTCYNLIDYISKLPNDLMTNEILALKKELEKDWKEFSQNPLKMV